MAAKTHLLALLAAVIVTACRQPGADHTATFEGGTGWLLSRFSEDNLRAVAAGDGEHVWLWSRQDRGLSLVNRSGQVQGLVTGTPVASVSRLGNGPLVAVVLQDLPGLYLFDRTRVLDAPRRLLVDELVDPSTHSTTKGTWIASQPSSDRRGYSVFFLHNDSLLLDGPWEKRGRWIDRAATERYLLGALEKLQPNGSEGVLEIEAIDRVVGTAMFTVTLPTSTMTDSYPPLEIKFSEDGRFAWIAGARLRGAARIDLAALGSCIRESRICQPLVFLTDRDIAVYPTSAGRAWALPREEDSHHGAWMIDPAPSAPARAEPVPWLADETVNEITPLDEMGTLVEMGDYGAREVILSSASGEVTPVLRGSLGRIFRRVAAGDIFLLEGARGIFRFDRKNLKIQSIISLAGFASEGRFAVNADKGRHFWITNAGRQPFRGTVLIDLASGRPANMAHPLFSREPSLALIEPFGDGATAVATSPDIGTMIVGSARHGLPIELKLGGVLFSPAAPVPKRLAFNPATIGPDSAISLPGWPARLNPGSKVEVQISCDDDSEDWRAETAAIEAGFASEQPLHFVDMPVPLPMDEPCRITAILVDEYGSRVTWQWSHIALKPAVPLVDRRWFRSAALFVLICLLAVVGASLRGGLQRWAPLGVSVVGSTTGVFSGVRGALDLPLLASLIAGGLVTTLACALAWPAVFRELERIEPLHSIAPFALSIGWIRRRVYAAFVARIADDVASARLASNFEVYAPMPFDVIASRRTTIDTALSPGEALLTALTSKLDGKRAHVLIESTGGRGKSALLREVVALSLKAFQIDPRQPLPIVCEGDGGTVLERAKQKLGTDGFSEGLFVALLRSGEFFLVIDGLTESRVEPQMVRDQLAAFGLRCPLLLAGRPNKALRDAFFGGQAWAVVEPRRLNDHSLTTFVAAYGGTIDNFSVTARLACRRPDDGTYLPILVRLALLIPGERPDSIADIFRIAVQKLLLDKGTTVDSAVDVCFATYWLDGERQLVYALAPDTRKPLLRELLSAGLLVPADSGFERSVEPKMVRFFHDTIQSYLTAIALSRQPDWSEIVLRAAGAPEFVREGSDLVTDGGSELFQMCLYTFEPVARLRTLLYQQLMGLADEFGGSLNRDWVVENTQVGDLSGLIGRREEGGDALLTTLNHVAAAGELGPLGKLYSSVVRHLWRRITAAREGTTGTLQIMPDAGGHPHVSPPSR